MELNLMRSLLAVVDAGAITAAADRVGLTQPALSRRIRQLEEEFGVALLSRGRKGVELTAAGELVAAEARVLVARYDALCAQVAAHQRLEGGTIRLGGGATAVSFVLPPAIADFQRDYPGVRFHLKEAGSREVEQDVVSGRLELGLVTMPVHLRELTAKPLMADRIVLISRAEHPLANRQQVDVHALSGMSLVGFEAGSAIRHLIDAALREAGVEMNVVMELRSIAAIVRMVATTGNLAFVSRVGVENERDVKVLPVRGLVIRRELAVIARRGVVLSPAAEAFAKRL
ncbi:MAG: DNA-binding transcriptional LysR family regulator [Gammaproteobacteria bacterium]|jgi:DNA-binding transcriptional LysR family regulator